MMFFIGCDVTHFSYSGVTLAALRASGLPLVFADTRAGKSPLQIGAQLRNPQSCRSASDPVLPLSSPSSATGMVLVLGNEAHGLPPASMRPYDLKVTIPIKMEAMNSLNVATAGTLPSLLHTSPFLARIPPSRLLFFFSLWMRHSLQVHSSWLH